MADTPYHLPEAEAGAVLHGSYVLRERLGEGGMGVVFLADQPALARTVAIKILHPSLATNPQLTRAFCDEAIAAGRVRHPCSVAVHDIGRTAEGALFIVMEYLPGRPLGQVIAEQVLSLPRALAIADQVLAAVGAAHDAGVVHADIKSDNFVVEELAGHDRVVLIDYGLARFESRGGVADMVSGTPEYLAPEVVLGETPTVASDLYAAGIILYELLTGATPFGGGIAVDILARHVEDVVIPPSLRRSDGAIPPCLDQLVLRALDKDPARRFADADEMRRCLKMVVPAPALPGYGRSEPSTALPETSPTRNCGLPHAPRLARGSGVSGLQFAEGRRALAAAIMRGDLPAIANGYLSLAARLVGEGHHGAAARELEEGIDVLSAGRGHLAPGVPAETDQLVFALANLYDHAGLRNQARRLAATADKHRTLSAATAR